MTNATIKYMFFVLSVARLLNRVLDCIFRAFNVLHRALLAHVRRVGKFPPRSA